MCTKGVAMKFPERFSFVKYKKQRFEYEAENIKVKIPSTDFPLNEKPEIFLKENTELLKKQEYIDVINEVKYKVGECYQNTEQVYRRLKGIGVKVETYVGWLIVQDSLPIHHCWCIVNNRHIIDLSDMFDCFYLNLQENGIKCDTEEKYRELYISYHKEAMKHKNSERCHLGVASINNLYIGSRCSPQKGIEIFKKIMDKNPNHPCLVAGTDKYGRTPLQKQLDSK